MKMADHTFGAYRYFIIPSQQLSFYDAVEETRDIAVSNFFSGFLTSKKRSWELNGRKHLLVFNRKLSGSTYFFKFGIETVRTVFVEGTADIENTDEIDYPFIYVVVDTKQQIVLIEMKTSVFSTLNVAKNRLKDCFEKGFNLDGFEVIFKEILDPSTFWDFVDNSQGVYEVALTLNSPNLFGGFLSTNKMLKEIKKTYNNLQTTIKISNKKAPLTNISKENQSLTDAIRYASGGGGEWTVVVSSKNAKRVTFKSKHNIQKISVPHIDGSHNQEETKEEIISALKKIETILKKEKETNEKEL